MPEIGRPGRFFQAGVGDLQLTDRIKQIQDEIARLELELAEAGGSAPPKDEGALRRAEQRWKLALEAVGDGVWDWNASTGAYYSPQWKSMLGYADDEFENTHAEWEKRIHPDDLERVQALVEPLLAGSDARYVCEYRLHCRDGSYKWVLARGRVVERSGGKPLRIVGTHNDITGYKAHEAEFGRLRRLYAGLSHVNQVIIRAKTAEELLDHATRALVEFGGFSMAWVGRHDPATHNIAIVAKNGANLDYVDTLRLSSDPVALGCGPAGTAVREARTCVCNDFPGDPAMRPWRDQGMLAGWRSTASSPIHMAGEVWGVLGVYSVEAGFFGDREVALLQEVVLDISFGLDHLAEEIRRRQVEQALKVSEERLKLALDAAALAVWERDLRTEKVVTGDRFDTIMGFGPGEFDGSRGAFLRRVHPDDLNGLLRAAAVSAADRTIYRHEYRIVWPDGEIRWIVARGNFLRDADGAPLKFVGVIMDATEKKRAEEALYVSEAGYRRIVDTATEGIWLLDERMRTTFVNGAMMAVLGFTASEMAGRPCEDLLFPEDLAGCRERMQSLSRTGRAQWDQRYRHKSGREVHTVTSASVKVDEAGLGTGYLVMLTDITERRLAERDHLKLTARMQQVQKLESVGRLAGGVAHDFNNLLTVINGYAGLVLKRMHAADPLRPPLQEIQNAGERATALVSQLLTFSRKQVLQREFTDLNAIVSGLENMLPRLLGEDIEIAIALNPAPLVVFADRHQIELVIMNLTVNSRDAMPHGGELTIATGQAVLAACPFCSAPLPAGRYACLSVRDTGTGIEPEIRDHLFEPFFTTKPVGKGTGLGLATVYGIVMESEGHIDVESEPGKGTAFHIWLPSASAPRQKARIEAGLEAAGGSETILLVEDQPEVRRFAAAALRQYGYKVIDVPDGESALAECAAAPVDMLLTDVVMPKMSGPELARRTRPINPNMRILFASGYAETDRLPEGEPAAAAFLQKPYSQQALAAKVREVLGRSRGAARILVVDPDEGVRRLLRLLLESSGFAVTEAEDGDQALRRMEAAPHDLVVADFGTSEARSAGTIAEFRRRWPSAAIIAAGPTADAVLEKPIDHGVLLGEIARLLSRARAG